MLAVATDMTHLRLGIYCFIQNLHYVSVVDGVLLKKYSTNRFLLLVFLR